MKKQRIEDILYQWNIQNKQLDDEYRRQKIEHSLYKQDRGVDQRRSKIEAARQRVHDKYNLDARKTTHDKRYNIQDRRYSKTEDRSQKIESRLEGRGSKITDGA